MKRLLVLAPAFNEEVGLESFSEEVIMTLNKINGLNYKLLFIDDGSEDKTWEKIVSVSKQHATIVGIRFTRNFGKDAAIKAGLDTFSDEDAAVCIDADFQHPPELIEEMISHWVNGSNLVVAKRLKTEANPIQRRLASYLFQKVNGLTGSGSIMTKGTDFRLIDKTIIAEFKTMTERTPIFRGAIDWLGFQPTYVNFVAPKRAFGNSSFTTASLIKLAIHGLLSFSSFPFRLAVFCCGLLAFSAFLLFIFALLDLLLLKFELLELSALILGILAFALMNLSIAIAIIFAYQLKIADEVIGRPAYVIKKTTN